MIDESAVNRTGRLEFTIYAAGDCYLEFIRQILKSWKYWYFSIDKINAEKWWDLMRVENLIPWIVWKYKMVWFRRFFWWFNNLIISHIITITSVIWSHWWWPYIIPVGFEKIFFWKSVLPLGGSSCHFLTQSPFFCSPSPLPSKANFLVV